MITGTNFHNITYYITQLEIVKSIISSFINKKVDRFINQVETLIIGKLLLYKWNKPFWDVLLLEN